MLETLVMFIKLNPKSSKYLFATAICLSAYLFNNKVVYNKGFVKGKESVVCPAPPEKVVYCKQEITQLAYCNGELEDLQSKYDKKILSTLDTCRKEETKSCEDKIDIGLKICVDFNCELCEDFRGSSDD